MKTKIARLKVLNNERVKWINEMTLSVVVFGLKATVLKKKVHCVV